MPKTWVTPQATIVSTIRSLTVRRCGSSGGTSTHTPSSRTSTAKVATPSSSCPPGAFPVMGQ
jgi:hypothetical protein